MKAKPMLTTKAGQFYEFMRFQGMEPSARKDAIWSSVCALSFFVFAISSLLPFFRHGDNDFVYPALLSIIFGVGFLWRAIVKWRQALRRDGPHRQ